MKFCQRHSTSSLDTIVTQSALKNPTHAQHEHPLTNIRMEAKKLVSNTISISTLRSYTSRLGYKACLFYEATAHKRHCIPRQVVIMH